MDYCLINILRRANKFFANNCFSKIIIKENKDKIRPSANAILDKFLRETVTLNIILFAKTRDVIVGKNSAINHSNYYLAVNNSVNISKLVQLLIKDSVFEEQQGFKYKTEILDLFALGKVKIATEISLYKYQIRIRKNQNKIPLDSYQKSDKSNKTNINIDDEDIQ